MQLPQQAEDEIWMRRAIELAKQGAKVGEVPVGAVVVVDEAVVGEAFNQPIRTNDPTAHAEVCALRVAAESIDNYRLVTSTLYVTIEPCHMCAGALVHARVGRVVFGAREPRAGAVCSQGALLDAEFLNHNVDWTEGVLAEECSGLISEFFAAKRKN